MKKSLFIPVIALFACAGLLFTACKDEDDTPEPAPATTYTVTFDTGEGGPDVAAKTGVASGAKITAPTPTKDGFDLEGWYKDADFEDAWDFEEDTVTANITLYAKWTTTEAPDNRVTLTAGEAVDVGAEAATADVTFTGATDLTLAAADFAVTEGATISDVAVVSDTVTVTITFSANTGETDVEYTVSINPDSEVIKGNAEVTVTQAAAEAPDNRVALTAGEAVDVGAEAATADVTFTGATDLTLAAADFAVTEGATISDVAVASDTVTVTITFSANTGETDVEYTVSINPDSEVIKGDAEATVTQAGTSG